MFKIFLVNNYDMPNWNLVDLDCNILINEYSIAEEHAKDNASSMPNRMIMVMRNAIPLSVHWNVDGTMYSRYYKDV